MSLSRVFAVVLLSASLAFSQSQNGTIIGIVLDGQTGRPVTGAVFSITGEKSDRNVTDLEGRYTIAVPPGSYTLVFSAPNYRNVQLTDVVVKSSETTEASTVMSNLSLVTSVEVVGKPADCPARFRVTSSCACASTVCGAFWKSW